MAEPKLYIIKALTFILALQILNMSICTQEFQPLHKKAATIGSVNEINSFAEYVAEVVLDYKDAMPEYQHHPASHKDFPTHKHLGIKLINTCPEQSVKIIAVNRASFITLLKDDYRFLYYKEINPPPPKA